MGYAHVLVVLMVSAFFIVGEGGDHVVYNLDLSHFGPREKLYTPIAKTVFRASTLAPVGNLPVVYPTDYGADPFGKHDSTDAFMAALKVMLTQRGSNHSLSNNIVDLGGAVLDLAGGDYLVSYPLVLPPQYGNFVIQRGTIRASSGFPSDRFIIELGSNTCNNSQGSCNENIGFEDLMLDCQGYAAGGLVINTTMGANVGPRIFVLGFLVAGISVNGGHEVMIHESWLGEYLYSDPRSHNKKYLRATGIQIFGNDHFITDTIVFSSLIGVEVAGAANLLTGVHTWNLPEIEGGIGILIDAPGYTQNRLIGCYLDYNDIVAVDPEHLTIVDGFFLCGGNIVLQALTSGHIIQGLVVTDNQFDLCGGPSIVLDQSAAAFSAVIDTTIDGNMYYGGYKIRGTRATAQLRSTASSWVFNFSEVLLFPTIKTVQYSIQVNSPNVFVQHVSRPPNGIVVTVETNAVVDATVTVTVDQSASSEPCCK